MDIHKEAEDYIRESIESSLGLSVSSRTLQLKLLASEDQCRRLQDQIFVLQERLGEAGRRLDQCKAESSMNAVGLRKCIEEKELMASEYAHLVNHCSKLEKECALFERDLERVMESCDELAKENEELQVQLVGKSSVTTLVAEVECLTKDKEHLKINLNKAEEEAKILSEENRMLDVENKRLIRQLSRERRHHQGSDSKYSAGASSKGKRKSSLREGGTPKGRTIDFNGTDLSRLPLSPLNQNSPGSKVATNN